MIDQEQSGRTRRQLSLEIDPELQASLAARARELERSVAGHVRMLIREDLAAGEAAAQNSAAQAA